MLGALSILLLVFTTRFVLIPFFIGKPRLTEQCHLTKVAAGSANNVIPESTLTPLFISSLLEEQKAPKLKIISILS